jgi:threonine dehydratase
MMATSLRCAGCGAVVPSVREAPYPFGCGAAKAGDDIDHVVERELDPRGIELPGGSEPNPFLRFRRLFHAYHVALANGMSDADYVALVEHLDEKLVASHGRGFRETPAARHAALSDALGFSGDDPPSGPRSRVTAPAGVWVKDETGNVGESHKARHLFGILIYLEVVARLGFGPAKEPPLAIASCGNAALAAGVVAQAAGRELHVFVPPHADAEVLARLEKLGAHTTRCPRLPGVAGDPSVTAFRAAVAAGAVPFSCQGSDAGLTIDGGATLGLEYVTQAPELDRVLIQVGGGAFASAVFRAYEDARALGFIAKLPRLHAVQTRAVCPLRRAYDRVADRILGRLGLDTSGNLADAARAAYICAADPAIIEEALAYAARHRSSFMWPWETEPHSLAGAIIDDETYDWLAVVRAMLRSGGFPITADEATLARANALAREVTGVAVGPSGSAGLAGLMTLQAAVPAVSEERVGVVFSGVRG